MDVPSRVLEVGQFEMTQITDELRTQQHEIQRMLGRCLLRLQQYEKLIKAIVVHHEIAGSGSLNSFESNRASREADTAMKTLGNLVGELIGSYVVTDSSTKMLPDDPDSKATIGIRVQLEMSAEDYARTESELREVVLMRNNLVHHFIDQHDLWCLEGCRSAHDELLSASSRIDQCFEQLRGWAERMDQTRKLAAEFILSDAYREFVINGIEPGGTVHWPVAGIVRRLREAAKELSTGGWTPIASAGQWIAERYPDQLPAKYGCTSWRQVVHESRLFELRYREQDRQRVAWYRPRESK